MMFRNGVKKWLQRRGSLLGTTNVPDRERWLESTLRSIPENSRILDAGAGQCQYKKYCTHLVYVSQDFKQYDGMGDDRGMQVKTWDQADINIVSDITAVPEPDASFDAIMCVEVFEHLPDPVAAIREFKRLLRANGVLVLTAPFASLTHYAPFHFYSGFNRYFYDKYLTENSFRVDEIRTNGDFFSYVAQEVRRLPTVARKYGNGKAGYFVRLRIERFIKFMEKMARHDRTSQELLCFGFHIRATKL